MKNIILLVTLLFSLTITQLLSQENFRGFNHNLVTIDFDNNGFVDDIAGINADSDFNNIKIWTGHHEQTKRLEMPDDLELAIKLKGKLVAGDFDNDGFVDDLAGIYEIAENKTNIAVWLNKNGTYKVEKWWYGGDFDANQIAQTIVSGDFDNDGFIDDIAAFYDYTDNSTNVFVWNSDSKTFNWPRIWWHGSDFNSTNIQGTIVCGDFDHDGINDDIAALYDYADNYSKIFVWSSTAKEFNWPHTWYQKENFYASKVKGNVIAGDFNHNGFVDNIAAFYMEDENTSEILVWQRNNKGFDTPETWWYGQNEGFNTNNRLVAFDGDGNGTIDEINGLEIIDSEAKFTKWTAENNEFTQPIVNWQGITLDIEDCGKDGSCLPDWLNASFEVFPNPSNGNFTLAIPESGDDNLEVAIYNTVGQLVYKDAVESGKQLAINVDVVKKGNYTVHVIGSETNYRTKIIIE